MADATEVKEFKQYLIETKAFQTLSEAISALHRTDPKPENPIQFICQQLIGSVIDLEEYHCMKHSFTKLNEDVAQLKADLDKLTKVVSKILPEQSIPVNQSADIEVNAKIMSTESDVQPTSSTNIESTNEQSSISSMENNIGGNSHISMLNDSSLIFDETLNQTVVDSTDLSETMDQSVNMQSKSSNIDVETTLESEEALEASLQTFTVEFVEVDVVNQTNSSAEQFGSASQRDKTGETMQMDVSTVSSEAASDKLPNRIPITSTPDHTISEEETLVDESQININADIIENMPIIMKEESSEDQVQSQYLYGFDTADVQESEKALAVLTTDKLNTDEHASKIDGSKAPEPSNAQSNEVENVIISKDRPTEIVANLDDEKAAFIQNAIDKGFQHIADDAVDGAHTDVNDNNAKAADAEANLSISMPKDDPETQLFLSYS